ncbi:MAG: hypothetical protein FJX83_05380 [Bacteroidetes bacterium]|nr:hypothetical protein [Bacteroidota bacterium]
MRHFLLISILFFSAAVKLQAQSVDEVVQALRTKLTSVKDYEAVGKLKTDVAFLKIPLSTVRIYYRSPDQFRIKKEKGVSVLPKGGIKVNMGTLLAVGNQTALASGRIKWKGADLAIVKLIPNDPESDIVLTTLYVDDQRMLIRKSITTTRENGTYEMEMEYGKYAKWGLPDKTVVLFNTKEYKLPKGITFEYDPGSVSKKEKVPPSTKGRIELYYDGYEINKGLKNDVFLEK